MLRRRAFLLTSSLLCLTVIAESRLIADNPRRQIAINVVYHKGGESAAVSIVGSKVTDSDLKLINMPAETESLSMCAGSHSEISEQGFSGMIKGLPIKDLSVSFYSGGQLNFLVGVKELKSIQRVNLSLNKISEQLISTLLNLQRPHEGHLKFCISILDGASTSQEEMLKIDALTAFTEICLVPRLNPEAAIKLAQQSGVKFQRLRVSETWPATLTK